MPRPDSSADNIFSVWKEQERHKIKIKNTQKGKRKPHTGSTYKTIQNPNANPNPSIPFHSWSLFFNTHSLSFSFSLFKSWSVTLTEEGASIRTNTHVLYVCDIRMRVRYWSAWLYRFGGSVYACLRLCVSSVWDSFGVYGTDNLRNWIGWVKFGGQFEFRTLILIVLVVISLSEEREPWRCWTESSFFSYSST